MAFDEQCKIEVLITQLILKSNNILNLIDLLFMLGCRNDWTRSATNMKKKNLIESTRAVVHTILLYTVCNEN